MVGTGPNSRSASHADQADLILDPRFMDVYLRRRGANDSDAFRSLFDHGDRAPPPAALAKAFKRDAEKIVFEQDVPPADKFPAEILYQRACGSICLSSHSTALQALLLSAWDRLVASHAPGGKHAKAPAADLLIAHDVSFGSYKAGGYTVSNCTELSSHRRH